MKRIIIFVVMLSTLGAAVIAPVGIRAALKNREILMNALNTYQVEQDNMNISMSSVSSAKQMFDQNRSFELSYGDIDRILQVLSNVTGVTVSGSSNADPHSDFQTGGSWTKESDMGAVYISLTVDDTVSALRILNKLEVPIYRIQITEPNIINIIFLTGGNADG